MTTTEHPQAPVRMPEYNHVLFEHEAHKRLSPPKQTVLAFLEAIAASDSDGVRTTLSEDAQWWIPPSGRALVVCPLKGADAVVDLVTGKTLNSFLPGTTTWIAQHIVEEVGLVSIHTYRHARGSNGGLYENEYNLLFRLLDNLIVEAWEVVDTAYGRKQLG